MAASELYLTTDIINFQIILPNAWSLAKLIEVKVAMVDPAILDEIILAYQAVVNVIED